MKSQKITWIFFLLLFPSCCLAGGTKIDSLKKVITGALNDTLRADALNDLSFTYLNESPIIANKYAREALEHSQKINYRKGIAIAYKNFGRNFYTLGQYADAVTNFQRALELFDSLHEEVNVIKTGGNIGLTYFDQGDESTALDYYLKGLKKAEEINDTTQILIMQSNIGAVYFIKKATRDKALQCYLVALRLSLARDQSIVDPEALGNLYANIGEIYEKKDQDDSALFYFSKAIVSYEGTKSLPYALNDVGLVYRKKGEYDKAIKYHTEAYSIAKKFDSTLDMAISSLGLAQTYQKKGDLREALKEYEHAEEKAKITSSINYLEQIYKGMSEVCASLKEYKNAFQYQELLMAVKDTIYNLDVDKKLGTLQFTFDIDKEKGKNLLLTKDQELKAKEISRQKMVRNSFIGGFVIVLLFASVFFKQRNRISKEKKRSDELLLNILPEETAEELKQTGMAKTKSFDMVSVLFTDFKNFTQASEKLTPEELVAEINHCYSEFDKIVTRHGIEKIKTIGDAYMCAGGLPVTNSTHPVDVVRAGIEMQEFIEQNKKEREERGDPFFELRLGIHTGPVVAGIVGIKKFAYDIWGDTVNTASRMESSGQIGKVNISGTTYELIKDKFVCTHRGKVQAKNKGEIDMYFVESEKQ